MNQQLRPDSILYKKLVTDASLYANTLCLYFEEYKHKEKGIMLWLDPSWRFWEVQDEQDVILASSRSAQIDEKEEHSKLGDLIRSHLIGKRLCMATLMIFNDLLIGFRNDDDRVTHQIQTFASEQGVEYSYFESDWHIEDHDKKLIVAANSTGVRRLNYETGKPEPT